MPHRILTRPCLLLALAACGVLADTAWAQQTRTAAGGRYYVYDQYVPPGVAGQMNLIAGTVKPFVPQQVRVTLPAAGTVTFYDGAVNRPVSAASPVQAALLVGQMYRLKISDLADYPHVDFYPSIELLDELHPPPGQAERFPIQVEFLEEELRWASTGRMITKVVYLEQPDRVPLRNLTGAPRVFDVELGANAIAEADLLGRPIAIVRLGGRTPDPNSPDVQFWGPLAPVRLIEVTPAPAPQAEAQAAPQQQRPTISVFPASATTPGTSLR
ncbi:MAG: hypothetical protein B7Z55_01560 [Planctomycetales bacterium 12-60-4]|nr:MAG: hypothetical protein B7Z55_01560 [Planctomycetales bacterium 12-60-4]